MTEAYSKKDPEIINEFLAGFQYAMTNWKVLLPFVGTITIFALYAYFFQTANVVDTNLKLPQGLIDETVSELKIFTPTIKSITVDLTERLYFYFSEFLLGICLLATIAVCTHYIIDSLKGKSLWRVLGTFTLPLIIVAIPLMFLFINYKNFTPQVMQDMMRLLTEYNQIRYSEVVEMMITGAAISIVMLMVAFCAILTKPLDDDNISPAILGVFTSRLKVLLYLGAATLSAAVLAIYVVDRSITQLPVGPFTSEDTQKLFLNIAYTHSMINGGFYTALLLGMYIPAAALFKNILLFQYQAETPDATLLDLKKRMKERGVVLTTTEQAAKFAALFAPLLAGFSGPAVAILQNL